MFWERQKVDSAIDDGASTSTAAVTQPIDIANEDDCSCASYLKSGSVFGTSQS